MYWLGGHQANIYFKHKEANHLVAARWRYLILFFLFLSAQLEHLLLLGVSLCTICFLHAFGGAKLNGWSKHQWTFSWMSTSSTSIFWSLAPSSCWSFSFPWSYILSSLRFVASHFSSITNGWDESIHRDIDAISSPTCPTSLRPKSNTLHFFS
jgi:hypothetical protein